MAIGEHEDDVAARLNAAADLLEAIVRDRSLLKSLPLEERTRLLAAAGDVHNPDVVQRRRFNKVVRREKKAARLDRDESALAETGLRVLREQADGIHMNSVDTGWVTDEDPVEIAERKTSARLTGNAQTGAAGRR